MEPYTSDIAHRKDRKGNPSLRKGGQSAQLHPHQILVKREGKALDIKSWKNRRENIENEAEDALLWLGCLQRIFLYLNLDRFLSLSSLLFLVMIYFLRKITSRKAKGHFFIN